MTINEAAEALGITPGALRQAIHRDSLTANKVGRDWSVTPREVERYRAKSLRATRGGKTHDAYGYVVFSSGPHAGRREHRVVMEATLGRPLASSEVVHHINGDKADNRPENLQVKTRRSHPRAHGTGREMVCSSCGARRWYQPALAAKLADPYRCRRCYEEGKQ